MNFLWESDNVSASGKIENWGMWIIGLLTIVFIVLKLIGVISWSWLWILSPIWIVMALWLVIVLAIILVAKNY